MGYTELFDPGKENNEGAHLRRSATTNAHGLVLGWLAVGGGSRSGVWCIQPMPAVSCWNAESKKVEGVLICMDAVGCCATAARAGF